MSGTAIGRCAEETQSVSEGRFGSAGPKWYAGIRAAFHRVRVGSAALHRVRIGRAALVASAICVATAPSPSWAADWTDASGNEYTALKYIKSNGTGKSYGPWITLTGIEEDCTCTDMVKVRFRPTSSGTQGIWCSRMSTSQNFSAFYLSGKIAFYRYNGSYVSHNTVPTVNDDCTIVANYGTREFIVNGISQTLLGLSDSPFDVGTIVLFATYTEGSPTETKKNRGSFYLYYFQIYSSDGTTLRHNLMPAQNADGLAGLYDTVGRKFYSPGGPTGYTTFDTDPYGSGDRAGKKWTGAGSDNLMSNGDNWEGGTAPSAGDDLDFTIAVPNAPINADTGKSISARAICPRSPVRSPRTAFTNKRN